MILSNIKHFEGSKALIKNFECHTLNNLNIKTTKKENRHLTKLETYEQLTKLNFEILDNTLYYNNEYYNRLYFDIDEINENIKLIDIFESINKLTFNIIKQYDFNISIVGYIRDTKEDIKSFINKDEINEHSNWFYLIQQKQPQEESILIKQHAKKYSFHIVILDALFKNDDLFKIFNYFVNNVETIKNEFNIKIDNAVYKLNKESQQGLRLSLSNKFNDKSLESDTGFNIEKLKKGFKNVDTLLFFTSVGIFKQNETTKGFLIDELNEEILNKEVKPKEIKHKEVKTVSIFQFINYNDKIINIKDLYQLQNHFDFSTDVLPYCHCVLTQEEAIEEILNLDLPEELHKNKTPEEWKNEIVKTLKSKIKQDITNIRTLYTLKGYIKKYYEQEQETNKNDKLKIKQTYKLLKPYLNKLDYYIDKYVKLNFVSHSYYNVFESKEDKKDKLIYNCFKLLDGEIIYAFNNKQFKNITQFRNNFKLNSNKANEIYELLTPFESIREFNRLRTEYIVKNLTFTQIEIFKNNIQKFLKLLKTSFVEDDDYKFYLSFYCHKLQTDRTINKGIINQGTETDPAINSFKTFFNELLNNYINIKSANVNNVNKSLNGTYFTGDLLVIEELPKKIKDIDNLINTFREYSSKKYITVEEKGDKPREILNCCDFIINTNHTVKSMFKDYNDAKGLLKRFRIITRQSIKIDDKVNELIDELNGVNNHIYQYLLRDYLINNNELFEYFNEHKNDKNDIMNLYLNASSLSTTMNKTPTKTTLEDFKNDFKNKYLGNKNKLKINKFRNYLIQEKVISLEHSKTLKQYLMILLKENKKNLVSVSKDGNQQIIFLKDSTDKAIELIYNTYFEYDETNEDEDEDKTEDKTTTENKTEKNDLITEEIVENKAM